MKRKILIVEDNISLSQMQKDWFAQAGYDVVTAMNEPIARSLIRKIQFDLILSDVRLPEGDGISLLEWLRKERKDIPFIITTEYVSVPDVVRTIKLGAIDYLPKPVRKEHLLELAEDVFRPMVTVRKQEKVLFHRTSPKILQVEKLARLVAPSEMSVMVLGANGTGKESVAQSIHLGSERREMPFVAVNCGALPRNLVQSELFGYEDGAFTGASRTGKPGKFELADGGTIFLDELGEMPMDAQVSLLRLLQNGEVTRIGGKSSRTVSVRVIAATNKNLEEAVRQHTFREDLYYRLNVFTLVLPPLRSRMSDIELLAEHFLLKFAGSLGKDVRGFTPGALALLRRYQWPGNIRELENVMERLANIVRHPLVSEEDLPPQMVTVRQPASPQGLLHSKEAETILETLRQTGGNIRAAAALLGVSRGGLYVKLRRLGIDVESCRGGEG